MTEPDVFEDVVVFPEPYLQQSYNALVGLDDVKSRLVREATLLFDPGALERWSTEQHGSVIPALETFRARPPLYVFAGDVGTGKTALARSFGGQVQSDTGVPVSLFCLSLNARGTGTVGEMTMLISRAFEAVTQEAPAASSGATARGTILLIDEADALAQSRELSQMHHEDRAGVNALIRGIDRISLGRHPILIVLCTNRLSALDPAIMRRAAAVFRFDRPSCERRRQVLDAALAGTSVSATHLDQLVAATGDQGGRQEGYTFSDLTQRLIPAIILDAFPDRPIDGERAVEIAQGIEPTPRFGEWQM